jgi:hypothetical protein
MDYKIQKRKLDESKMIKIYMISNKVAFNFSKSKRDLYSRINGERWLPRRSRFMIFGHNISIFLRFRAFSTPINFQKQLSNLILALQEWNTQTK